MSTSTNGGGYAQPDGDREQGGNSPDVMNASILPINCSLWWGMDDDCVKAMNKILIDHACKVADSTAAAYRQIQTLLETPRASAAAAAASAIAGPKT